MVKNNIKIEQLDAYAKRISEKQVNMLYEAKMQKKYSKPLFENKLDIDFENEEFKVFISNFTIQNLNINVADAIARYTIENSTVKTTKDGIYVIADDVETYKKILEMILEDDLAEYTYDSVNPDFRHILEK